VSIAARAVFSERLHIQLRSLPESKATALPAIDSVQPEPSLPRKAKYFVPLQGLGVYAILLLIVRYSLVGGWLRPRPVLARLPVRQITTPSLANHAANRERRTQ
jgi:hypothetical protein